MRAHYERERLIWESGVSPTEKLVLLAFNSFADGNGSNCYPSYQTIAQKTGYNRRTIIRVTGDLSDRQILEIAPRTNNDGHRSSNLYRINFDRLDRLTGSVPGSPEGRTRSSSSDRQTLGGNVPGSPDQIQLRSDPVSKSEAENFAEHTPGNFQVEKAPIGSLSTEKNLKNSQPENFAKSEQAEISSLKAENSECQGEKFLNAGGGAVFCQAGPFLARIAEEKWRTAYNTTKAPSWLPWGIGCLSGTILEGVSNFLSVAKDEDEAIETFKASVAWAAKNEAWLASKRFRPSQLLDPNSKNFLGQFREVAQSAPQPQKPATLSWEERIRAAINPLAAWEAMA